mmetsp:Transcript_19650/g.20366  ORF Transcript_19650/g.20366 Transcript_19650/m.20366 type:complete len:291 (+) Transcript_19650:40-912(+)
MFNFYLIALLFFHLSKLSLALDKCSQDVIITCSFKYLSDKNCNKIGKPCTSFRQLNWVNSSVNDYSCLTNGVFTNSLSYDVDQFGLCDGVGIKSLTGTYGQNCYCNADKVVSISSTATFTATIDYTLNKQPTYSPTSKPTIRPTRPPSLAPTSLPSVAPTPQYPYIIPNIVTYFTNYCGGTIGWENLLGGVAGSNIKKCKYDDANKQYSLTPSYYVIPVSYTLAQGTVSLGAFSKMYFSCNGNFEIYASSNNQLLYSNFACDGTNYFLNLVNVEKYMRVTSGTASLMIFD